MINQREKIIIGIFLPIFIFWGFFSFKYWWSPEQQLFPHSPDYYPPTTLPSGEASPPPTEKEKMGQEEKSQPEEIISKGEELISEAQELITKTQEFIEEKEKEKIVLIEAAKERSSQVKGIYMTEFIASSQSPAAVKIRQDLKMLLEKTELNSIVIDVKEAYGPNLPNSLKKLIEEFHQKNIWVIARIVAFRDASLIEKEPALYLKTLSEATSSEVTSTTSEEFWKDWNGGYWLDPSSFEVQNYIIEFSQRVIDFGFDELQFDYFRFPSDGDLENIIYPFYNSTQTKSEVIREFSLNLSENLRSYQPSIILSVDLFGYIATQYEAPEIGQRLIDFRDNFDYLSLMLYPSHFYDGFEVKEDLERELPALYFPYIAEDISQVVSNQPYQVVLRSIFSAADYLFLLGSTAEIRPWLQDFNLKPDTSRGIYYDAGKIQAQIKAVEDSGASGWLLWNPANIYTEEAFKEE